MSRVNPLFQMLDGIPQEWKNTTIGAECIIGSGGTPNRSKKEYYIGSIPWIKSTELNLNTIYSSEEHISEIALHESSAKIFPKGTLLLAMYGLEAEGTRGKCAILGIDAATNQACAALQSKGNLNIFYLFYYYQLIGDRIMSIASGTKRKNLSIGGIKSIPIPLPSLHEQYTILNVLQTADNLVETTTQLIKMKSKFKQILMRHLFTQGIGHRRFKQTKIGEIPESWEVVKLGNPSVTSIVGGTTPSRDISSYWGGKIPWATPTDVTALDISEIAETKDMITENGIKKTSVKLLPVGSVLMTSRATIGYCALNTVPIATNQGFASFICTEKIHNKFLLYLLESIRGKLKRYASGSTFKEISKSTLRSMLIQLPPINEQQRITEILDTLGSHILIETRQKNNLEQLKRGLMQVLLTGKVRVKV